MKTHQLRHQRQIYNFNTHVRNWLTQWFSVRNVIKTISLALQIQVLRTKRQPGMFRIQYPTKRTNKQLRNLNLSLRTLSNPRVKVVNPLLSIKTQSLSKMNQKLVLETFVVSVLKRFLNQRKPVLSSVSDVINLTITSVSCQF